MDDRIAKNISSIINRIYDAECNNPKLERLFSGFGLLLYFLSYFKSTAEGEHYGVVIDGDFAHCGQPKIFVELDRDLRLVLQHGYELDQPIVVFLSFLPVEE